MNIMAIIMNYLQLSPSNPFSCLTNVEILSNRKATTIFSKYEKSIGVENAKLHIVEILRERLILGGELKSLLEDEKEKVIRFDMNGPAEGETYAVRNGVRRLGMDTGRDILINVSKLVNDSYKHMTSVLRKPTNFKG